MEIIRLYQGYPVNKNQFFAPSIARRSATPGLRIKNKKVLVSKEFLNRLVTPALTKRKKLDFDRIESGIITRDNLSYHIQRSSQIHTPVPQSSSRASHNSTAPCKKYILNPQKPKKHKYYTSACSPSETHEHLYFTRKKIYKNSCDVGIQNVSTENFQYPNPSPSPPAV